MPSLIKEFLLIGLCCLLGVAYSLLSGTGPRPWAEPDLPAGAIRYTDAKAMPVLWIDAREAASREAVPAISEALLIDPSDWEASIPGIMERWLYQPRPIVVYCSSAACQSSESIATAMRRALPEAEIYYLLGGWPQ